MSGQIIIDELRRGPEGGPFVLEASALTFTVFGEAKPGGSKRAFRDPKTDRIVVVDDSGKAGRSWRQEVANAGLAARAHAPWGDVEATGPLAVEFTFFRARPKGHYGSGANAGLVKASAPAFPVTRPDALKLARAVEDALTKILWADDSQIVDEVLRKRWGTPERVEISVRTL
jgi:Holliday junction resolvase RusA-like endonuclease